MTDARAPSGAPVRVPVFDSEHVDIDAGSAFTEAQEPEVLPSESQLELELRTFPQRVADDVVDVVGGAIERLTTGRTVTIPAADEAPPVAPEDASDDDVDDSPKRIRWGIFA